MQIQMSRNVFWFLSLQENSFLSLFDPEKKKSFADFTHVQCTWYISSFAMIICQCTKTNNYPIGSNLLLLLIWFIVTSMYFLSVSFFNSLSKNTHAHTHKMTHSIIIFEHRRKEAKRILIGSSVWTDHISEWIWHTVRRNSMTEQQQQQKIFCPSKGVKNKVVFVVLYCQGIFVEDGSIIEQTTRLEQFVWLVNRTFNRQS